MVIWVNLHSLILCFIPVFLPFSFISPFSPDFQLRYCCLTANIHLVSAKGVMHVADTTKSLDFGGFLYRVHEDLDLMLDGSLPTIRMINVDGGVLFISTYPFQEDYPSFFREVCLVEYRRGVRYFHMYMCIMLFSFFSLSRLFAVLIWFFRSFLLLVEGTISPPVGLLASFLRCSNRSHLRSPSVMVPP